SQASNLLRTGATKSGGQRKAIGEEQQRGEYALRALAAVSVPPLAHPANPQPAHRLGPLREEEDLVQLPDFFTIGHHLTRAPAQQTVGEHVGAPRRIEERG